MGAISERLELIDRFSGTFRRWIDGIKNAVEGSDDLKSSTQKLEQSVERSSRGLYAWNMYLDDAIYKGVGARDSLETIREAFRNLVADLGTDNVAMPQAMAAIEAAAKKAEYTWTDMANGLDKVALMTSQSFAKLEQNGYLVRNELDQQEEELPKWAQRWEMARTVLIKTGQSLLQLVGLSKKASDETEKSTTKSRGALDLLGKKVLSIGALFFTARRIVRYFREGIERAPDNIARPYEKLKENIRNVFDRSVVSGLAAMKNSLDRLNDAFASPAGQKFVEVLSRIGYVIGTVVGSAINLLINLIGLVIDAIGQMGVSADMVVNFIATIASALYVTLYNIVATIWNVIASFAEFLVNVWSDPAAAIQTLFWRLADAILGFIQSIGNGFDALMSKLGISTGVGDFLGGIRENAAAKLSNSLAAQNANALVLDRMDLLDYGQTAQDWQTKATGFDPMSLQLKAINQNTRSAAKSAASIDKSLQDADIKALIDVAERKFVSMVNLTSQTPVITVNGANTGNSQQDRINLANAIRDILLEQLAVGATTSSAVV